MNYSKAAQSGTFQSSINSQSGPSTKSRMAGDYLSQFQFQTPDFKSRSRIDPKSFGSQLGMIDPSAQVNADYSAIANKADRQRRDKLTSVPLRETTSLKY